jgi:hypothetical protein
MAEVVEVEVVEAAEPIGLLVCAAHHLEHLR